MLESFVTLKIEKLNSEVYTKKKELKQNISI